MDIFFLKGIVSFLQLVATKFLRMTRRNKMSTWLEFKTNFKELIVLSMFWDILMKAKTSRAEYIFIISLLYSILPLNSTTVFKKYVLFPYLSFFNKHLLLLKFTLNSQNSFNLINLYFLLIETFTKKLYLDTEHVV